MTDYIPSNIPPQAVELEAALLGLMLLDNSVIPDIVNVLKPTHFYKHSHELIYKACLEIYENGGAVDIVTVCERLTNANQLQNAEGALYVSQLTNQPCSLLNLEDYIDIILQRAAARLLIADCSQIIANAYDCSLDFAETARLTNETADRLNDMANGGARIVTIGEATKDAIKEAKNRQELVRQGKTTGIPTGLKNLDLATAGWRASDLVIIAGRPGMGKTALLLHFAKAAAISGTAVCIYSLEMSSISLANRMLLGACDADPARVKHGNLTPFDSTELNRAAKTLEMLPIYIDDKPVVSMQYIRSNARAMARKGKCGMVLIDYLQLAEMPQAKNETRERVVSAATRIAKITAKELKIPVLLVSQLNRNSENRAGKKPQLSDLRESGAIEQDADIVAIIHRPHYYDETAESGAGILAIEKHRDGATGDLPFSHNESLTKIWDYGETPPLPSYEIDNDLPF